MAAPFSPVAFNNRFVVVVVLMLLRTEFSPPVQSEQCQEAYILSFSPEKETQSPQDQGPVPTCDYFDQYSVYFKKKNIVVNIKKLELGLPWRPGG